MIQYASNSKKIASPLEPLNKVWTKDCPQNNESDLEHLLFLVKEKRNLVGHKDNSITNLTDIEMEGVFSEIKAQLTKIIEQAGIKANIPAGEINRVKKKLEDDIKRIHSVKVITSLNKQQILEFLRKEDIENIYLNELKEYFMRELKGFTTPNILYITDNFTSNLKHIFQNTKEYQLAIIYGEAGTGKTSLTK